MISYLSYLIIIEGIPRSCTILPPGLVSRAFTLASELRALAAKPSSAMQRSRRNVPQNSKQGALAQLRAIKSGDAKRSDQFEVRLLPLIAPSSG